MPLRNSTKRERSFMSLRRRTCVEPAALLRQFSSPLRASGSARSVLEAGHAH
jgi:hypothetical protein